MENQKLYTSDSQLSFFTPDAKMIHISFDTPRKKKADNNLVGLLRPAAGKQVQKGA